MFLGFPKQSSLQTTLRICLSVSVFSKNICNSANCWSDISGKETQTLPLKLYVKTIYAKAPMPYMTKIGQKTPKH